MNLTADGDPTSVEPVETPRRHPKVKRQIVLYVHISQEALSGAPGVARVERGNQLITSGQARDWCRAADQVTVKPVLDLPARHRVVATVRDQTFTPT